MDIVRPVKRAIPGHLAGQQVWRAIDCSNGGISAHVDRVTIVGVRDPYVTGDKVERLGLGSRVSAPTDDAPAAVLVKRYLQGVTVWHVEPLEVKGWVMAGGTYCATSDSRINEITGVYGALALHDRVES